MLVLDGDPGASVLAFSADDTRLIAAWLDRFDVWSLPAGQLLRTVRPVESDPYAARVASHPGGEFVIVAGSVLDAISLIDGKTIDFAHGTDRFFEVLISPDGGRVVALDRLRHFYGFGLGSNGRFHQLWRSPSRAFDETGAFIGPNRFVTLDRQFIFEWDVSSGRVRATHPYPAGHVGHPAASPDGTRFAILGDDKFYVWDTATWGWPTRVPSDCGQQLVSFAFHPLKPVFAAVRSEQTSIEFFDTVTWKSVTKYDWNLGTMRAVTFSPDGSLAAAISAGGKIVVWDVDV